jgi:hypothetical protein
LKTRSNPQSPEMPEARPVISFARLIEIAPSSHAFGGWGVNVSLN